MALSTFMLLVHPSPPCICKGVFISYDSLSAWYSEGSFENCSLVCSCLCSTAALTSVFTQSKSQGHYNGPKGPQTLAPQHLSERPLDLISSHSLHYCYLGSLLSLGHPRPMLPQNLTATCSLCLEHSFPRHWLTPSPAWVHLPFEAYPDHCPKHPSVPAPMYAHIPKLLIYWNNC